MNNVVNFNTSAPIHLARLDENNDAKPLTTLVAHIPVGQDTTSDEVTECAIGDLDADTLVDDDGEETGVCECGHEIEEDTAE